MAELLVAARICSTDAAGWSQSSTLYGRSSRAWPLGFPLPVSDGVVRAGGSFDAKFLKPVIVPNPLPRPRVTGVASLVMAFLKAVLSEQLLYSRQHPV
jgi:hypothetical protein